MFRKLHRDLGKPMTEHHCSHKKNTHFKTRQGVIQLEYETETNQMANDI